MYGLKRLSGRIGGQVPDDVSGQPSGDRAAGAPGHAGQRGSEWGVSGRRALQAWLPGLGGGSSAHGLRPRASPRVRCAAVLQRLTQTHVYFPVNDHEGTSSADNR